MSQTENKENRNGTKIPIPLKPLPQLPRRLIKSYSKDTVKGRVPLRTISGQDNAPLSSSSTQITEKKEKKKPDTLLTLDTRFLVTKRGSKEPESEGKLTFFIDGGHKKTNEFQIQTDSAGPSVIKPKSPARKLNEKPTPKVKNTKPNLKRPRGKETQGISPCNEIKCKKARRVQFEDQFVDELLQSPDEVAKQMTVAQELESEEIFQYLLEAEKIGFSSITTMARAWIINWLIKINSRAGDFGILQTAVWLLDRLTFNYNLNVQLVAAACFWIAQKMQGPVSKASRIARLSDHAFTVKQLVAVEKNVLQQLRFPSQPIIPNDFITYLAWICDAEKPGTIEVAANFLYLSALMVNKRCCYEYPSVLAAAAVLNAVELLDLTDCMPRLIRCQMFQSAKAKAQDFTNTCLAQCMSVTTVSSPLYGYKTIVEHFGSPPAHISTRISEAIKLSAMPNAAHNQVAAPGHGSNNVD